MFNLDRKLELDFDKWCLTHGHLHSTPWEAIWWTFALLFGKVIHSVCFTLRKLWGYSAVVTFQVNKWSRTHPSFHDERGRSTFQGQPQSHGFGPSAHWNRSITAGWLQTTEYGKELLVSPNKPINTVRLTLSLHLSVNTKLKCTGTRQRKGLANSLGPDWFFKVTNTNT